MHVLIRCPPLCCDNVLAPLLLRRPPSCCPKLSAHRLSWHLPIWITDCEHAPCARLYLQVPRNNAERVFFILTNILGTCFYAAVLGQMALLVTSLNTVALRHK